MLLLLLGPGLSGGLLFAQNQQAVLIRGNIWQAENPGFGNQTINTFFGEYCVEHKTAENQNEKSPPVFFYVRLCSDAQILSGDLWQPRPGIARSSGTQLQRQEKTGLFIGIPFTGDAGLGSWVILFQFPNTDNTFDDAEINRLVNAWLARFRHFFSLIQGASEISLPAVVSF